MRHYVHFLWIGLILGLFTEIQLKLIAGINPSTFAITLVAYPIILTFSYFASRLIDRTISTSWKGDALHYMAAGIGGLLIEWKFLANGLGSNAFQLGMFAMWTTFCFGPRILTRPSILIEKGKHRFWMSFGIVAILLTSCILITSSPKAKIVVAVIGLSATYVIWSIWLLILAWRSGRDADILKPASS